MNKSPQIPTPRLEIFSNLGRVFIYRKKQRFKEASFAQCIQGKDIKRGHIVIKYVHPFYKTCKKLFFKDGQ